MLTLLSLLCACCVAGPQAVAKTLPHSCTDADDTKAFVSKGHVCVVQTGSDTPSVGCCKSAHGATCGASGHACAVAGPAGARKIISIAGQPGCCVVIGGKGASAACCQSGGHACCSSAGHSCGMAGGQGVKKIMRFMAEPGCGVALGGGAFGAGCCPPAKSECCPPSGHMCGAAGGQGVKKIMRFMAEPGCGVAPGGGASGAGCCPPAKSECCPQGGPTGGVSGGQGTAKTMYISAKPGCGVALGGGAALPGSCQVIATPLCLTAGGDAEAEGLASVFLSSVPDSAPKAWLGVSTSPVPEALQAHIGQGGLMIGNIVVGSPADEAGLQRYDVVVSFDGKAIKEMDDLLQALGDTEQGETVKMVVIRSGEETKLTITPGERPEDAAWEYKYEQEEEKAVLDDQFVFRGHQLKLGPSGDVILQPLGRLKDLPDPLRSLQFLQRGDDDEGLIFRFDTDDEAHGEMEIKIKLDRDGEALVIHRTKDGKVTVERTDKDGETSSATYESVDELEEGDPEAYRMLHQGGLGHAGDLKWTFRYPDLEELPKLQKRYQTHIDLNLQKALEKVREAQGDAGRAAEKALQQYRQAQEKAGRAKGEARKKIERWVRQADAEADLDITVHDDGSISVSVRKGDTRVLYEFKSKDDFKQREPELFKKFSDTLE